MDPVKPAVKESEVPAAVPAVVEVKKEESAASPDLQVDFAAQLAAKDAELAKLAAERDNYKTGMLKAKGKLPEDEIDNDDVDTKIQKAVQEALYSESEKKLQAEKDAILQKALTENKELKVALQNKQGISTAPDGPAADDQITGDSFFSPAQVRELKAKGWSDEKIKKAAERMKNK